MMTSIIPDKEYYPSEIAKNGFILSGWGNKNTRFVLREIQKGRLKAKSYIVFGNKAYKVLGSDIIVYKKWKEEKKEQQKLKRQMQKRKNKQPIIASV